MVELWQSWAVLKISYLMFCKSFIKYDVSNQRSLKLLSQSHFILQLKLYCTCTIYLFTKISHIFQWALSIRWKVMIFNFRKFPGTKETAFYTVFPEKKGTEIFGNILLGILVPFDFPLEFPEFWFAFLKFNISRIFWKMALFPKFRNLCLNTYGKCSLPRYEKGADASKRFDKMQAC